MKELLASLDCLFEQMDGIDLTEPMTAEFAYRLGVVMGKYLLLKEATDE